MKMDKNDIVEAETKKLGIKYLGAIPLDPQVESAIGDPTKLIDTAIGKAMRQIKISAKSKSE
jgi:hypothetical protein